MRPSRFTDDQIRDAIAQVFRGLPLVVMCRRLGVTQTTFYRWRAKYGQPDQAAAGEVQHLRDENVRLKQLVGDLSLERQQLREAIARKAPRPAKAR
jgi:putative transposase